MPTFLSEYATDGIRLCPRILEMAQPSTAGGTARISFSVDYDLPFPVAGPRTSSHCYTTGKSNTMASEKPAGFSRTAMLHYFRDQSFTAKLVFDVTALPRR